MARNLRLFCGVLSFYCVPLLCGGFNVDHRFPVIKEGKTSGSFFGFSVALHKQTVGGQKYLLLTGAPKEKALAQMNVNETGAVYSCPITTEKADCSRMDLVTTTDPSSEMVEGMWLGVTVASQKDQDDGRVLACGHRYVKVIQGGSEQQWMMVGKCYVRGNDLTYDPNDDWQAYLYEYCNPAFELDLEGMCGLGISGGLTSTQVYVGSTGSYTWQGNVHTTWRNLDPAKNWDSSDKDFGQLNRRYNYLGYSVLEDQKLLISDDYTLVTGAPRDRSTGSVTLGRMDDKDIVPVLVIPGKQVGSYFGNSLAVADLNNDDWNDLMVGAPFYFDRAKDHGGAVYVYMNENGSFQKEPSLVLKGPVGSAFGFALAAAGDLNQDGFQDFAVGAPFHDKGKVYIWMGSKEGISEKYSQVIEGTTVGDGKFNTFGYSLNGGMDMDANSYPDLLVGTLDDRIALLRTRPVLHLTKEFSVQPRTPIDPAQCSVTGKACIKAKVCFSYTLSNGNKSLRKNVVVKYTVEADIERWRSWRVYFRSSKNATHTGTITLSSPDQKCQRLELNVVALVRDKLEPVVFQLNASLPEQNPDGQGLQDLDAFPVLSQQKMTQRAEINFQKACGSDNKCSSNLQLTAEYTDDAEIPYPRVGVDQVLQYDRNVKKVELMVEVTNLPESGKLAEDAHQAMLNVSIPDVLSYSGVRFTEGPTGECQLDTELHTVICELGNPLGSGERVKLRLIFETGRIDLNTRQIKSYLQLSTLSEQDHLDPVPVLLLVEVSIQTTFTIEQPHVQTYFSGEVVGESAMKKTSDVGSLVEYTFNVEVLGAGGSSVGTLGMEFEWPLEAPNGKWLLYLTEITMNGTRDHHCVPPGETVNALNLKLMEGSSNSSRRTRRQAAAAAAGDPGSPAAEPPAVATLLSTRKETVTLDCGTAQCAVFTCPLQDMQTRAKVTVRSRVWNGTLLEDYSKALRVKVKGKATLKLITDMPGIKMESQTREFSVDIDPVLGEEAPYQAPLWIIIVAAVAGILLLGVISLILWKCGFFRRASRREMYEAKAQKAEMKIQPSETEKLTEDY